MNDRKTLEIMASLRAYTADAKAKLKEISDFEIDPDSVIGQYRDMLNDSGPVLIYGLTYDADQVLEAVDPTAFRCGLNDFVDTLDVTDDPNYAEQLEELDRIKDDLEAQIDEIGELIDEIEKEGPNPNGEEWEAWSKITGLTLDDPKAVEREAIEVLTEIENL